MINLLSLTLFVLGVLAANNANDTAALNHPAVLAHLLH